MAEAGHKIFSKIRKEMFVPVVSRQPGWSRGSFPAIRVLEVACNMGTTTIELAKTYGCQITAVDLDKAVPGSEAGHGRQGWCW